MDSSEEDRADQRVQVLASGVGFCEGPVATRSGDVVCVSWDHGRVYRVEDGAAIVVADVGVGANGATEGRDGRLFIAQSGGHAPTHRPAFQFGMSGGIQIVDTDGTVSWLTMDPIRPNDLCFGPDDALWVTDPHQTRRDNGRIWRVDATTGVADLVADVDWYTNGIAFGPWDDAVFVADTYGSRIMRFRSDGDWLGGGEEYLQLDRNHPDGFAFDSEGNLVIAAVSLIPDQPGEIQVWDRAGVLVERVALGSGTHYTNVALGDGRLIVTDSSNGQVLSVDDWPTAPLPLHPFRIAASA